MSATFDAFRPDTTTEQEYLEYGWIPQAKSGGVQVWEKGPNGKDLPLIPEIGLYTSKQSYLALYVLHHFHNGRFNDEDDLSVFPNEAFIAAKDFQVNLEAYNEQVEFPRFIVGQEDVDAVMTFIREAADDGRYGLFSN